MVSDKLKKDNSDNHVNNYFVHPVTVVC